MWVQLLVLGVVIGFNNFATAIALGALGRSDVTGRILAVFAAFEFGVPLLGLWLGQEASEHVAGGADWLGPALLAGLGLFTLFESTRETRSRELLARRLTTWGGLIALAAGLSIDNLVVGFSLGLGGVPPLLLAFTIMTFSVVFTWVGLRLGRQGRGNYETPTELASGALLIGLAAAAWSGAI